MMPVEQMPQLIEALASIAEILGRLGVPGLVALVLAGPAAVLIMILVPIISGHDILTFETHGTVRIWNARSMNIAKDGWRNSKHSALVEQHRADTQAVRISARSMHR